VFQFQPLDAGGFAITQVDLDVRGTVPGLDADDFQRLAGEGEAGCPVSNALRGNVDIRLKAALAS
jgi:osmotically inducible protein OsmC